MSYRFATFASAAAMAALVAFTSAPSFAAASSHMGSALAPAGALAVTQQTINAGPQPQGGDPNDYAQSELDYLTTVCPTVLAHPGSERPNLVQFCHEPHG